MASAWEILSAAVPPSTLEAWALAVAGPGPHDLPGVAAARAALSPAAPTWPDAPRIDPAGALLTRTIRCEFGPADLDGPEIEVAALALVDTSAEAELLGVQPLSTPARLRPGGASLVVRGTLMVIRQQE